MKLRQEDCKAGDSLECVVRSCLKKKGRERRGGGEGRGKGKGEEAKDHKQIIKDWTSRKQKIKRKRVKCKSCRKKNNNRVAVSSRLKFL